MKVLSGEIVADDECDTHATSLPQALVPFSSLAAAAPEDEPPSPPSAIVSVMCGLQLCLLLAILAGWVVAEHKCNRHTTALCGSPRSFRHCQSGRRRLGTGLGWLAEACG